VVAAPWVEKFKTFRITLTPPIINQARQVTFLITGVGKAEVLRKVMEDPFQPEMLPSQAIRPISGQLTWFLDQEAARNLSTRAPS